MTPILPTSFTSKIPLSLFIGSGIGYPFKCIFLIIYILKNIYMTPMLVKELLLVITQPLINSINFGMCLNLQGFSD